MSSNDCRTSLYAWDYQSLCRLDRWWHHYNRYLGTSLFAHNGLNHHRIAQLPSKGQRRQVLGYLAFPGGPFFNDIEHWTWKSGGNLDEEVGICVHGFEFERPFWTYLSLSESLPFQPGVAGFST